MGIREEDTRRAVLVLFVLREFKVFVVSSEMRDRHHRNQYPHHTPKPTTNAGQGVALDGIPVPEMRKRMGAFLDALGLRTELQGLAASTTYYLTPEQVGVKLGVGVGCGNGLIGGKGWG